MLKKHVSNQYLLLRISFLTSIMFGIAFGLGACKTKPEETDLPFETFEQKEWAGTDKPYESREPGLIVISRLEEVDSLKGLVSDEAKSKLQALDYSSYFAVLVLQGWKPTTGYKANVNRITRIENTVNIYAQFLEPKPDEEKAPEVTSPYHLVQVQKSGKWGQDITFNLFAGEISVISLSHAIP